MYILAVRSIKALIAVFRHLPNTQARLRVSHRRLSYALMLARCPNPECEPKDTPQGPTLCAALLGQCSMASLADSLRNRKACYGSSETQIQNRPMEGTDASIIFLSLD